MPNHMIRRSLDIFLKKDPQYANFLTLRRYTSRPRPLDVYNQWLAFAALKMYESYWVIPQEKRKYTSFLQRLVLDMFLGIEKKTLDDIINIA